jgi:poly [ADP-ribose] polymerase
MALGKADAVKEIVKPVAAKTVAKKIEEPKSKLDGSQQALVSMIFDMDLIEKSVIEVGYDPKRLPLGQLSKDTVKEGYKYLREIEKILKGKGKGDLKELTNMFYTYIPHNFGFKNMANFVINTIEKLKEKLDLI